MQGCYYEESLTGQWYESPNRKPRITTLDSYFDFVGFRKHRVASNEVIGWSADPPLNADGDDLSSVEIQIQIFADRRNWHNVTCKTRDKAQLEKSRISCRCRHKETAESISL